MDQQAGGLARFDGVGLGWMNARHDGVKSVDAVESPRIVLEGWMDASCLAVDLQGNNGHAHCSRRSELTNHLGENPGGNLGTAQANLCCWLTPIGPQLASCQAPHIILWDAASLLKGPTSICHDKQMAMLRGRVCFFTPMMTCLRIR